MNLYRVYGIMLRNLFLLKRNLDRITDVFYWPTIDLVLWGLTSAYFIVEGGTPQLYKAIVSATLFWMLIYRSQIDVALTVLEDMWNKNLVNVFVSPISFKEWVFSITALSTVKTFLSFVLGFAIALIFYDINVLDYGLYLPVLILLCLATGWWTGFLLTGAILRYGTKVQSFGWTIIWLLAPFSVTYFPLSFLPEWAQAIARALPSSYIFEGMREFIAIGSITHSKLYISAILSVFYLLFAFWFFGVSFKKALKRGLVKLY